MIASTPMTNLGFSAEEVPVGTHMCLVYSSEKERKETLLKFLLSGMRRNEKTACFSGKISEEDISTYFRENGISYDERKKRNMVSLSGTSEVYFAGGTFDPDRMLSTLSEFYRSAVDEGLPGSRVIGEMDPQVENIPGGERLCEYESRVSLFVQSSPVTAVCQYDANAFNGATIMEILKVHPKMIVNGSIVSNPFYIKPEEYLKNSSN